MDTSVIDAALTKDFASPCHKMLRTFPDFVLGFGHKISRTSLGRWLRAQCALEQLYQTVCANTREAGGLLPHRTFSLSGPLCQAHPYYPCLAFQAISSRTCVERRSGTPHFKCMCYSSRSLPMCSLASSHYSLLIAEHGKCG
jgi:hypothetical protein